VPGLETWSKKITKQIISFFLFFFF
jgi:hypothetical protein